MLVIYTPQVTHRISYVLEHIFGTHFGLPFRVVSSPDDIPAGASVLAYTDQPFPGAFSVPRNGLLLSGRIEPVSVRVSRETSGMPILFEQPNGSDLVFDLFAAVFYLLSRYEEYLPHDTDEHGRFRASGSIMAHPELDFSPIVDAWLQDLALRLRAHFPGLPIRDLTPESELSFDIDQAFAFLGRGWQNKARLLFRPRSWKVLTGTENDPYDTLPDILRFLDHTGMTARFFFLLQDKGRHNSMVDPADPLLHSRIQNVAAAYPVGIHPSYDALPGRIFSEERDTLQNITGQPITHSRQHFLRVPVPAYYPFLMEQGILHDHSMGYSELSGFRAGYSRSFRYFDLAQDRISDLTLHPFAFMDATYIYYKKLNSAEIFTIFSKIKRQVSKVNGKLVTVSHNDLLVKSCPVNFWEVLKNCAV